MLLRVRPGRLRLPIRQGTVKAVSLLRVLWLQQFYICDILAHSGSSVLARFFIGRSLLGWFPGWCAHRKGIARGDLFVPDLYAVNSTMACTMTGLALLATESEGRP